MLGKKAISPVVSAGLLLVVAVIAIVSFQNWFQTYQSTTLSGVEVQSNSAVDGGLRIESLIGDTLYVINKVKDNLSVSQLKIGNNLCSFTDNLTLGMNQVPVSDCTDNLTTSTPDIVLITEKNVVTKKVLIDGVSAPISGLSDIGSECRFKDNKTGCESYYELKEVDGKTVVQDTLLGLYWEQSPSYTGTYNWTDAKNYCEVTLGNGWRLPTLTEMETSLVDTGRASMPYIVGGSGGGLFSGIQGFYWTNTRYNSTVAYYVSFFYGRSYSPDVSVSNYVLCVREDGSNPGWQNTQNLVYEGGTGQERVSAEFLVDDALCGGAGTMYDEVTNLCWEKSPSTSLFTWENAVNRCSDLVTAEGGWRLPEKAELMTLLQHAGPNNTYTNLNSIGFSGIQNLYYWSNTKYAPNPSTYAYSVGFYDGYSISSNVINSLYVLCVK